MTGAGREVRLVPVTGLGEVTAGTDLAAELAACADLADGDVLLVTSKVVGKAEGRAVRSGKEHALLRETDRVVARRGPTTIVRTHHGLVLAGAGIDASNTEPGTVVLLPEDPDRSARLLREALAAATGHNVAVLVTDTAGRAWREGQTDLAVGAAGLEVVHDYAGRGDGYGNVLTVTAPAVADELAAAGDLVKGKLDRCPAAVVRGLAGLVLPAGEHGPGARALVRPEERDMFGYGAREAVHRAVAGRREGLRGFGRAGHPGELLALLRDVAGAGAEVTAAPSGSAETVEVRLSAPTERELGRLEARTQALAFAHGWLCDHDTGSGHDRTTVLRLRRGAP